MIQWSLKAEWKESQIFPLFCGLLILFNFRANFSFLKLKRLKNLAHLHHQKINEMEKIRPSWGSTIIVFPLKYTIVFIKWSRADGRRKKDKDDAVWCHFFSKARVEDFSSKIGIFNLTSTQGLFQCSRKWFSTHLKTLLSQTIKDWSQRCKQRWGRKSTHVNQSAWIWINHPSITS